MMKKSGTQDLVRAGLLLALAIVLPMGLHAILGSGGGQMFLPMHLPVFLSGLLVGPIYGAIIGAIAPALSYLLTGMPPMFNAIMPRMVFELAAYGFFSGVLYQVTKRNVFISLLGSMIAGRIVLGIAAWVAVKAFGFELSPIATVVASVVSGWPGLISQMFLVPLVVRTVDGKGETPIQGFGECC